MKGNDSAKKILDFIKKVEEFDFDKLPISDYNKQYIANLKPAISYYANIYWHVLLFAQQFPLIKQAELTVVDYGGGCGFFSIFMKLLGIHKVIYIDKNPASVHTMKELGQAFGILPDAIICGDSPELVAWSRKNNIKPNLVIGLDVIEHIYNLRHFFKDIVSLNKNIGLVFTTGSNPMNAWKCRKLRKEMDAYEKGNAVTPNYYTKRLKYIKQIHPDMEEEKAHEYAAATRGMNYPDIRYFIKSHNWSGTGAATHTKFRDKNNTCDPETGNYMERILPFSEYTYYLSDPEDGMLFINNGFYNPFVENRLKRWCAKLANYLIYHAGTLGIRIAPFVVIAGFRNRTRE